MYAMPHNHMPVELYAFAHEVGHAALHLTGQPYSLPEIWGRSRAQRVQHDRSNHLQADAEIAQVRADPDAIGFRWIVPRWLDPAKARRACPAGLLIPALAIPSDPGALAGVAGCAHWNHGIELWLRREIWTVCDEFVPM
jgi:hypothetical protein